VWTSGGWADRFALPLAVTETGYGHRAEQVAAVRADVENLLGYYERGRGSDARVRARVVRRRILTGSSTERWTPPVTLGAPAGERDHRRRRTRRTGRVRAASSSGADPSGRLSAAQATDAAPPLRLHVPLTPESRVSGARSAVPPGHTGDRGSGVPTREARPDSSSTHGTRLERRPVADVPGVTQERSSAARRSRCGTPSDGEGRGPR